MGATDLLDYEFDQYKRYTFLAGVFALAYGPGSPLAASGTVRVLDVGSGPSTLTATFLGPAYEVTRSDADTHGQPDILPLRPGAPLDAPDASYDGVVCLEVLEHVPKAQRSLLVHECLRVARHLVVISVPNGTEAVAAAERRICDVFEAIKKTPHPFLREHRECGLPTEQEIRAYLDAECRPFRVADNVRLDHWQALLMADILLHQMVNGPKVCSRMYRRANAALPGRFARGEHYRKFYVAAKDESLAPRLDKLLDTVEPPCQASEHADPLYQLGKLTASMLVEVPDEVRDLQDELRRRNEENARLIETIRRYQNLPVIRQVRYLLGLFRKDGRP
jgi:hypothetical protein